MALASKFIGKNGGKDVANDSDPREESSAEIIDFASRTSYPVVAQRKGKSDAWTMVAGIGLVGLLGAATLYGMNAARTTPEQPAKTAPAQAPAQPDAAQQAADAEAAQAQAAQNQQQKAPANNPGRADPAPSPVLANAPKPSRNPVPAVNPYASPTLIYDQSGRAVAVAPPVVAAAEKAEQANVPGGGSAGDFASRVGGVGGGPATAVSNFDPATTVTQGTLIPAILETAIDTDVPGFVRAIVSQDVKSYDGRRTLVPRSSRLIGQYQSGLQNGQKRAYVIWTRLIRPDGVSVALASPATDFSGKAGLPGEVNSRFFQRFGSAMLLSVIGGLSAVATGGTSVVLGGGQSAAAAAIQQNNNVGPSVRVRQGEPIRVFTARDLDFSTAPRL